jgi:hypothetical protein
MVSSISKLLVLGSEYVYYVKAALILPRVLLREA